MIQEQCKVINNRLIAADYYELVFTWNENFVPKPGQFLTIKPEGLPLLRRPFAFSDYKNGQGSIIYKTVGDATSEFSKLKPGDEVSILGPLGVAFSKPAKRPVLVAGGIGLGPMIFTANYFKEMRLDPVLVVGARDKSFIPEMDLADGIETIICTDDGSMGFKGNVAQYLESDGKKYLKDTELLGCGPHIMLKACHNLALKYDLQCQVSLEEMMACAVGACYGCVVETNLDEKYKRVCKDGPVFNSREIIWT
ncbi:MAG: dihydroorotate dehydrogenase electron transfer subunit [Spirochaetaceae bacterium]